MIIYDEWSALLFSVQDVQDTILGTESGYPDIFRRVL